MQKAFVTNKDESVEMRMVETAWMKNTVSASLTL